MNENLDSPSNDSKKLGTCLVLSLKTSDPSWIIDVGASNHIIGNKFFLKKMKDFKTSFNVKFAGNQIHCVQGKGDFNFQFPNGEIKIISDILYILNVKKNLLSIGTHANKGLLTILSDTSYLLTTRGKHLLVVIKGIRDPSFGLYLMNFTQSFEFKINNHVTMSMRPS